MKTRKFLGVVLAVMLAMVSGGEALAAETSGSASVDVMSNYVWRGQKLSDEFVIQPSVGITYGGFGANIWGNYDSDSESLNETDVTLDYAFAKDKLGFDVGYIYYALEGIDDTQEIYLSVSYDTLLAPALTIYYDFDEGEGAFIVLGIGHSIAFGEKMALNLGATASYNASNDVMGDFSGFYNGEVSASLGVKVTDAISIEPKLAYSFPLSDDAEEAIESVSFDSDSSIFYGGVNVSLSF